MSKRKTNEQFINELRSIYGDKYDYSQVKYVNSHCKVKLICPIHGEFEQRPNDLLNGHSCQKCSRNIVTKKNRVRFDSFIKIAKSIHPDFEYDENSYLCMGEKVRIKCPIHGWFEQRAIDHIRGHSCPKCSYERKKTDLGCSAYNDTICESKLNGRTMRFYRIWYNLLNRVINGKYHAKYPTYTDCKICDDWLLFSNFLSWCKDPSNGYKEGYELDKDILCGKNKIYSPNTCCFIPHELNNLFRVVRRKSNLPIGVYKNGNRYVGCFRFKGNRYYKSFPTVNEASEYYKTVRKDVLGIFIKGLFHKGGITERVFNAVNRSITINH